jgi:membrane protease YdiL (CAAX protease family)
MKKLYEKDPLWFAVFWIILYVVGFGNAESLSAAVGIPKLFPTILGFVLSATLYGFMRQHGLLGHWGLCAFRGNLSAFLYFLPLIAISSVNFWYGLAWMESALICLLHIVSMCFVGFLEEVIFRGFLFKGMSQTNVTAALIISSLTFGAGHIVNLLLGAPLLETLLQLVNAASIGFCYTVIFLTGGSILPCILSHAFINASSIIAREPTVPQLITTAILQLVLSLGYGLWLLYKHPNHLTSEKKGL